MRHIIEDRQQQYNAFRPHSALNWLTPNEFARGVQHELDTPA
ncbi:MAG: transposase [Roseibium sp.]|nr:transposase [Roseibium sp.]